MAQPPTKPPAGVQTSQILVAGQFWVDIAHPLPGAGGGLPAFAVTDQRDGQTGLMGVQVRRHLPVRAPALRSLAGSGIDGLLAPLAYGAAPAPGGEEAGFLICQAPPGPPLSATLRPWLEPELLAFVLRPAARVLDRLAERGLTHRAIRVDNLFRVGLGHPVVLGCAWATPPASLQPAAVEPPYVSVCLPGRRGEGTIADDVYALGVLMLTLALGRSPLVGQTDAEITYQKLDQGSYATLIGEHRPGSFVADLLRGMLAEDPEHRPPPSLLLDPAAARSRRTAGRPPHRAPRPLQVGDQVCWHPRTLAHALATQPALGLHAIKTGAVGQWLRRGLGDGTLAVRLEEHLGLHDASRGDDVSETDSLSLMRTVAILDPLAPMCWNSLMLWPDAIGTALAALQDPAAAGNANQPGANQLGAKQPGLNQTGANQTGAKQAGVNQPGATLTGAEPANSIARLVASEAHVTWAGLRPERGEARMLRQDARQLRALLQLPGPAGGVLRLTYQLNPLLPCTSPGLELRWVARLADLMPALEAAARRDAKQVLLITPAVAAFIAARGDRGLENAVTRLGDNPGAVDPLAQLRLLAQLQSRYHPKPLPALGGWVTERAEALLAGWHSRPRRMLLQPKLRELATSGELATLLALLEDPQAHRNDELERQVAVRNLGWLDATLAGIATGAPARAEHARRLGQEVAAGLGLTALAMMLLIAALG